MLPAKHFKICHTFRIQKVKTETHIVFFQFFIQCYFISSPNECPGRIIIIEKIKQHIMKNKQKNFEGFHIPKLWQNLKHFIKHTHLISEEWSDRKFFNLPHIHQLQFLSHISSFFRVLHCLRGLSRPLLGSELKNKKIMGPLPAQACPMRRVCIFPSKFYVTAIVKKKFKSV